MNVLLVYLSLTSCRIQFHTVIITLLLTGTFMLVTASDLGAMGPLVIFFGIYIIFFATAAELLVHLRLLLPILQRADCSLRKQCHTIRSHF